MNTKTVFEIDDDGLIVELHHTTREAFIRDGKIELCLGYLDNSHKREQARTLATAILEAALMSEELYPATRAVA